MTLQTLKLRLAEIPFDPRYVATNVDEVAVVGTDVELRVDVSSYREEARELQNDLDEANATIRKFEGDLIDAEEERAKLHIELGGTKADLREALDYKERARNAEAEADRATKERARYEARAIAAENELALLRKRKGLSADLARHATCVVAFLEQLKPTLDPKSFEAARLAEIMHKIRG